MFGSTGVDECVCVCVHKVLVVMRPKWEEALPYSRGDMPPAHGTRTKVRVSPVVGISNCSTHVCTPLVELECVTPAHELKEIPEIMCLAPLDTDWPCYWYKATE